MNRKTTLFALATFFIFITSITTTECSSSSQCEPACETGCTQSQNLFQTRSVSTMSQEIFLEKPAWLEMADDEGWHGTVGFGFLYNRNFGEIKSCKTDCDTDVKCCNSLGAFPFWAADKSNKMTIGTNNGMFDIDAFQFGLGPITTNGTIELNPTVSQIGADLLLYFGSSRVEPGFWMKIHGPIGRSTTNAVLTESEITPVAYPTGTLSNPQNATDIIEAPYKSITEAFEGKKVENAGWYKPMSCGLITCNNSTEVTFGDLAIAIGYNFIADEKKHLGIGLKMTAPTGTRATGEFVLEPIFGRNEHWGIGGEIISHYRIWESNSSDTYVDFWFDGVAEHLFRSKHKRTFDLKGHGLGSKYLLLARYRDTMNVSGTNSTDADASVALFQNEIQNAVNLTCVQVESSFAVAGNFALMFDIHSGCWNYGIGYEFWGRSCETLNLDAVCPPNDPISDWAIIGRQQVYTFDGSKTNLGLVEPKATINTSKDAKLSQGQDLVNGIVYGGVRTNRLPEKYEDALDIAAQRAHTAYASKLFGQIGYTAKESDYLPYIATSFGAEFSHTDNSALNFWTIGIQGGLSF